MTIGSNLTRGGFSLPWVTVTTALLCVGLFAAFGGAPETLVYDRGDILGGQWWRLVTGQLVHLDLQHLVYNVGALLALGVLYETARFGGARRLFFGVLGFGSIAIVATVFIGTPATLFYCGLSAALNALYAATTIGMWRETGQRIWLMAFLLDVGKITWEAAFGSIFSSALAWPPHTGAHIAGLLAGTALAVWSIFADDAADSRWYADSRLAAAH